jgi:hypothetical protein
MRVFEFYRQPARLASEIYDRFSAVVLNRLDHRTPMLTSQKRPVTRRLSLATKIGDDRSTETMKNP